MTCMCALFPLTRYLLMGERLRILSIPLLSVFLSPFLLAPPSVPPSVPPSLPFSPPPSSSSYLPLRQVDRVLLGLVGVVEPVRRRFYRVG
jgi:hypothetical protein